MFFSMPRHEVTVTHWFATWVVRFALLMLFLYHFIIGMIFSKLNYELTANALIINTLYRITLPFSGMVGIREADQSLKLNKIYAYTKESPQVIHYVGQFGLFKAANIGKVFLYSTLTSLKEPKGLILLHMKNGKIFGISPENPKEFINLLQERIKKFKGQPS